MKNILVILSLVLSPFAMGLYAQCDSVKDITVNGGGSPVLSNDRENLLKERFSPNLLDVMLSNSNVMGHFQGFYSSAIFYDSNLLSQFMAEPLVAEFRNCIETFELEVYNGILRLKHVEDAEALYDTLIYYSDKWDDLLEANPELYKCYIVSETFPNYPMLYAFETIMGFYSLRAKIENELLEIEAGDGFSLEEDDPDDHFIVSPFMRTLLTPNCEIIVDSTIYLTGEDETVEIANLNMGNLQITQDFIRTLGEEEGMKKACLEGYATQSGTQKPQKSTCDCDDVTIKYEPIGCDNTYKFSLENLSLCAITGCQWSFGDGTSENFNCNPIHTYSQADTYTIWAGFSFSDGRVCNLYKTNKFSNCPIEITKTQFKGTVSFVVSSPCDRTGIKSIKWDFGDGTSTTTKDGITYTEHEYQNDEDYIVFITVTFNSECVSTEPTKVTIVGTGKCCKMLAHERERGIYYSTCNNKYIKHVFALRNGPLWHRFVVRSIHFELVKIKKNKKEKWSREKADYLYVSYYGQVYDFPYNDRHCKTLITVGNEKPKKKQKEVTLDKGYGSLTSVFRIPKNGISSYYEVEKGNCKTSELKVGFTLHDKECPK